MTTESAHETFQLTVEVAEAYEARFVPAFFAQWAPRLVDAAGVTSGQRVLDVACGTGVVARTAADRVRAAGLDVVLSQMAMMFFPEPAAALREMRRVARRSGTVGVLVPGALPANRPYELFVDIVTRHAGAGARSLVTTYFALGDIDQLAGLFTGASLTVTAATHPVGESRFGSVDEFVAIEIDSTPLGDRLDPKARERIRTDCQDAMVPWLARDGSLRFPFECNLLIARAGAA